MEMPKPGDFYVGVLDVFSILLPGAIVTWTVWVWLGQPTYEFLPQDDSGKWVAFILSAYAIGHIVFMVASEVDRTFLTFRRHVLYRIKKDPDLDQNALQAITALRLTSLSAILIIKRDESGNEKPNEDVPSKDVAEWAKKFLPVAVDPSISEMMNSYQWSRAVLRLRAPAALAEVLRFEADSKFFRSLFIVFVFLAACSFVNLPEYEKLHFPPPILLVALAALSYWRYAERRQKGIEEAYRSTIVYFTITDVRANGASTAITD